MTDVLVNFCFTHRCVKVAKFNYNYEKNAKSDQTEITVFCIK